MLVENVNSFLLDSLRKRGCFIVCAPMSMIEAMYTVPINRILSIYENCIVVYNGDKSICSISNDSEFLVYKVHHIDDFLNIFVINVIFNREDLESFYNKDYVANIDITVANAVSLAIRQRIIDQRQLIGPTKYSSISRLPAQLFNGIYNNAVKNNDISVFQSPYSLDEIDSIDDQTVVKHYDSVEYMNDIFSDDDTVACTEDEVKELESQGKLHYNPNFSHYTNIAGQTFYPVRRQVVDIIPPEQRISPPSNTYKINPPPVLVPMIPADDIDDDQNPIGFVDEVIEEDPVIIKHKPGMRKKPNKNVL